jgi:predicted AlkP superfamily pyrophosphatase or phosphodiesterase
MNNKVLLIIVDGMRPDSIQSIPFAQELIKKSSYTFNAFFIGCK